MAESVQAAAIAVLETADPAEKAATADALFRSFAAGRLPILHRNGSYGDGPHGNGAHGDERLPDVPDRPARPDRPRLLPPSEMPARRKGGSARGRFALLHALAHIEFNAIDLAADIVARFAADMPPDFTRDWLQVGAEEAAHFLAVAGLLAAAGGRYGDLPAHDGLWEAAEKTAGTLAARLAIVPLVLEARGLDVTPAMIARFEEASDDDAARVLRRIFADEIGHVATGRKWFEHLCHREGNPPAARFRALVKTYFKGSLKPPFNDSARLQAGLTPDWYS